MRTEIFTFGGGGCIFSLTKCESLMLISILTFLACESQPEAAFRVLRKEK